MDFRGRGDSGDGVHYRLDFGKGATEEEDCGGLAAREVQGCFGTETAGTGASDED